MIQKESLKSIFRLSYVYLNFNISTVVKEIKCLIV